MKATTSKGHRRLPHWQLAGGLLVASVVLLFYLSLTFRTHLFCQYLTTFGHLGNVQGLAAQPIPATTVPADWIRCQEGPMEFWLPPELAMTRFVHRDGQGAVLYRSDRQTVVVYTPEKRGSSAKYPRALRTDSDPATSPRFLLEVHQAQTNDFRWSMTSQEVARHTYRITMGEMVNDTYLPPIETDFRADMEGILRFPFGGSVGVYEWESLKCDWEGSIHFISEQGDIQRDWVRIACRSFRLLCEETGSASDFKFQEQPTTAD